MLPSRFGSLIEKLERQIRRYFPIEKNLGKEKDTYLMQLASFCYKYKPSKNIEEFNKWGHVSITSTLLSIYDVAIQEAEITNTLDIYIPLPHPVLTIKALNQKFSKVGLCYLASNIEISGSLRDDLSSDGSFNIGYITVNNTNIALHDYKALGPPLEYKENQAASSGFKPSIYSIEHDWGTIPCSSDLSSIFCDIMQLDAPWKEIIRVNGSVRRRVCLKIMEIQGEGVDDKSEASLSILEWLHNYLGLMEANFIGVLAQEGAAKALWRSSNILRRKADDIYKGLLPEATLSVLNIFLSLIVERDWDMYTTEVEQKSYSLASGSTNKRHRITIYPGFGSYKEYKKPDVKERKELSLSKSSRKIKGVAVPASLPVSVRIENLESDIKSYLSKYEGLSIKVTEKEGGAVLVVNT